jgi:hypothetical protein
MSRYNDAEYLRKFREHPDLAELTEEKRNEMSFTITVEYGNPADTVADQITFTNRDDQGTENFVSAFMQDMIWPREGVSTITKITVEVE